MRAKTKRSLRIAALCLALFGILSCGNFTLADETTRPTLILESYTISEGPVAGEEFVLEYTLRNTSALAPVSNILFTIQPSSDVFYPSSGRSNQYYIRGINSGEAYTGQVYITAKKDAQEGVYPLAFALSYQGPSDGALSTSGFISIEIKGMALEAVGMSLPEECVAGRPSFLSLRYTNSGSKELRGAKVILEGAVDPAGMEISIGTVRAGGSGVAEGYVTFRTTGEQTLTYYLAYESDSGDMVLSEPYSLSVKVTNGVTQEPGALTEPGGQTSRLSKMLSDNTVLLIAGIAAICVVVIVAAAIKNRKKR